jgi:biotin carboxylase
MKKRVMILGASRYYARSILAAKELGFAVVSTDRNPQADGFKYADYYEAADITDIDRCIEVARKYSIDGVVAVNDFGVRTAAAIAEGLGLPGISRAVAEYATSKAWMRRKWQAANVPSAQFRVVATVGEAHRAVRELNVWPLILKPADSRGGGSRGVSKIERLEELERAFDFAQSFYEDKSVVIEEFLDGTEHSVETITYDGETHVLAVSDKVKTPPPYRVDKSVIYPTIHIGAELERIYNLSINAVRALGIDFGAAHLEMCTTSDGPRMFELGARCGGGGTPDPIVPFLTGIHMFKEVVKMAVGEKPGRLTPMYMKGCVYRFLTPSPGTVRQIHGLDEIREWDNILDCDVLIEEGDEIHTVRAGGDRAGFIIAGGQTRDAAIRAADEAESRISFEYQPAAALQPVLSVG